jgi:hypothetical protein
MPWLSIRTFGIGLENRVICVPDECKICWVMKLGVYGEEFNWAFDNITPC